MQNEGCGESCGGKKSGTKVFEKGADLELLVEDILLPPGRGALLVGVLELVLDGRRVVQLVKVIIHVLRRRRRETNISAAAPSKQGQHVMPHPAIKDRRRRVHVQKEGKSDRSTERERNTGRKA
eukprot:1025192-Rhodomonas_salina.1